MSDIVKRLYVLMLGDPDTCAILQADIYNTLREAADRIEALEKAIREWSTAGNSTEAAVAAINLRCALEAK